MVYLYVIQGRATDKRYVGITNDLDRRLKEHRGLKSKGGQILGGDFFLLHSESHEDYVQARIREKFLKSGKGRELLREKYPV